MQQQYWAFLLGCVDAKTLLPYVTPEVLGVWAFLMLSTLLFPPSAGFRV